MIRNQKSGYFGCPLFFPKIITDISVTFRDLGLSDPLLDAISAVGYENPTPIREKSIPVVLMMMCLVLPRQGQGKQHHSPYQ